MAKILTVILSIFAFVANGQKTISHTAIQTSIIHITSHIHYNANNSIRDTIYTLHGRDFRYNQIIEYVLLRRGSISDINSFIVKIKYFLKQEVVGASSQIDNSFISITTLIGIKYINVYGIEKYENGYTGFTHGQLSRLINDISYYCNKNKIPLK